MMLSDISLCPYEVDIEDMIGNGMYGEVYGGRHRATGTRIAAKRAWEHKYVGTGHDVTDEIDTLMKIPQHQNVIGYLDKAHRTYPETIIKKNCLWIITKFCELGDLENYSIKNEVDFAWQIMTMHQCTAAIYHLHQQEPVVVHRDIKPENVLITNETNQEVMKISDFGLSKVTSRIASATAMMGTMGGTPLFMPPEMCAYFEDHDSPIQYDKSVDIYALGLLFITLLNARKGVPIQPPYGRNLCSIKMFVPLSQDGHYKKFDLFGGNFCPREHC